MAEAPTFMTLAFFDLETTGLPSFEFFKTKITELCLIACTKQQLLETRKGQCPRVIHKLSLCLNPRKLISPTATAITGLDNLMLEFDNGLNENAGQLLSSFLQHLQQPVCLVAHNGDSFDFPLLKKQLRTISVTLPDSLCCVDSLPIFREIDRLQSLAILDDDDDDLLAVPLDEDDQQPLLISTKPVAPSSVSSPKQTTSDTDSTEDWQKRNETTPSTRVIIQARGPIKARLNNSTPTTPSAASLRADNATPLSKRKLFDTPEKVHKKRFSLTDVYERLHGKKPSTAHFAEADTISLLKCVSTLGKQFVELAESECKLFSYVKE